MKRKNTTRNALFTSIISMLLCVSMLVGTTFAWFTDEVTSGGNKIQAGTLQIDLLHLVDGEWISLKDNSEHKVFDYDLWEPGYTQVETLKIANLGNLALQYQMNVVAEESTPILGPNGENLADVIDVYMCFGESEATSFDDIANDTSWWKMGTLAELMASPEGITQGKMLPAGATYEGELLGQNGVMIGECAASIALHMQEAAGNEYQGLSVGNLYINLNAIQYTFEEDSFDDQYDANAGETEPDEDDALTISTIDELRAAAAAGGTYKLANNLVMDASEPVIVVSSEFVFNLNGFDLDFSAFATRPFEMAEGASFTINAEDEQIVAGQTGFINIPASSTLIINGGKFSGNVAAGKTGALFRVASAGETTVQLNDVDYTTDANAIALDSGNYTGNAEDLNITVNGGTYETGYVVFYLNGAPSTQIKNATINSSNVGVYLAKNGTGVEIDNCKIYAKTTGVGIAGGGTVYVRNSNVTSDTRAFQVYSSGGTIDITNTTYTPATYSNFITGKTHKSDCVIIIDGVEVYRKLAT